MRSAHVTVQGQHFCSLKSQCADVNDVSKHKQAVNSVNNAKAIRYKHTSAPNNALLAMAGAGNRGGSRRTRCEAQRLPYHEFPHAVPRIG